MTDSNNQFIKDFQIGLENSIEPIFLIQNEINQINFYLNSRDEPFKKKSPFFLTPKINSIINFNKLGDKNTFNQLFFKYNTIGKIEIDNRFINPEDYRETIIKFSEYYKWLNSQFELLNSNKKTKPKTERVHHKQQMLILYYLGLNLNKYDNTKMAELLTHLLGFNIDNNRKYLSYIQAGKNTVRTHNNLKAVKTLFESCGMKDISNKIQDDIDNLK